MPVKVSGEWIETLNKKLPELPVAVRIRFQTEYGLPEYDSEVLTSDKALADYFEAAVKEFPHPKQVSNWVMVELLRELKKEEAGFASCRVTPTALGKLLALVEKGTISGKLAKTVFEEMVATGKDPEAIVRGKGLVQITDAAVLAPLAREIMAAHPKEVADYKAGKTKLLGFFVGQLMRQTRGQANPQMANEIFQRLLGDG